MLSRFYNRTVSANGFAFTLNEPAVANSKPGPALLPIGVTTFTEGVASAPALGPDTYGIIPPSGGRYNASPSTRALIFPAGNKPPIDLGVPSAGQVIAHGYTNKDQLCIFDVAQFYLGCQINSTGLKLHSMRDLGWNPELQITPITYPSASASTSPTMTLRVVIPSATVATTVTSALQLHLQLYPPEGTTTPLSTTMALANGAYRADLALPSVMREGMVRVWVDEPAPRRETVSDYAIGGNPTRHGDVSDNNKAPALSPDGQAILYAQDTTFASGQFFALQRTSSLPKLPPWATVVGQGYRLIASDPTMLSQIDTPLSLSLSYAQADVPVGMERDARVLFYDGTGWTELSTHVDITHNEAAVTVQATPGIYVLVTSLRLSFSRPGWSLLYSYPGASKPLPLALQSAQDQRAYDLVYGYDPADAADPWKLFSPQAPDWVNDLAKLQEGSSYWLHLTKAASIALPIPGLSAQEFLPAPPSSVYGRLDASWGFAPEAGLSVQALVGNTVCGSTSTRAIGGGQFGFVLDMLALDGERPHCGSNGAAVTLRVLTGSSILRDVAIRWQNDQIRAVGPDGVLFTNHVYMPLLQR
jgi:hypothetical protein